MSLVTRGLGSSLLVTRGLGPLQDFQPPEFLIGDVLLDHAGLLDADVDFSQLDLAGLLTLLEVEMANEGKLQVTVEQRRYDVIVSNNGRLSVVIDETHYQEAEIG